MVDGDPNLLRASKTLVTSDGYQVRTVVDGFDAPCSVAQEKPDLIVSDVMMPRMDGADLICALRGTPARTDIPVGILPAAAFPPGLHLHVFLTRLFSAAKLLEVLCEVQPP
ncbi:response regulator [Paraburkholderia susongensis]|uniref:response regulator n=1 Tax=Paraburkholderia susongensis TaxID=1515439 RepID=UPI000A1CD9EE|nr:response regulator [Paraburkholderia susongensis]